MLKVLVTGAAGFIGFANVLEACRRHIVQATSSSVYGANAHAVLGAQ
jgi:nucleoside-diphosphate-sugar epimerase